MSAVLSFDASVRNVFELPIARTYVKSWGIAEGVREIMQNAIDSDSPFEYEFKGDKLTVRSRFATLAASTLLLGATSKDGDDSAIGSFGEGYKIAMLVLVRDGYEVRILNGDRVWTPSFAHSDKFGAEVLIVEDEIGDTSNEGLAFEVSGLTNEDISSIRESCLFMQDHIGAVMTTSYGKILREKGGKLYVGGLYVCDTDLQFGYDMKPEHLKLERDRQTVGSWQLQRLSRDMWYETGEWEEIAKLIADGCEDLEHSVYSVPEELSESLYKNFREKHPTAIAVKNHDEMIKLAESGFHDVVVEPAFAPILSFSPSYRNDLIANPVPAPRKKAIPKDALAEFLRANRKAMRGPAIVAFKALLSEAESWELK